MAKLGDVCNFYSGTGFPNAYQGDKHGKYPFYKVGDISKNVISGNVELISCDNYINDDVVNLIKGTIIPPQCVVFAKIGEALKLNRRALTSCYCLVDNNVMGVQANNLYLDSRYFYYFMCNVDWQRYSESTAVPSVRKSRIAEIEIPLPSLEEQRHIAAILDKVTDLIAQRRAQLDKLDLLVKSRFVEMFGDPVEDPFSYPKKKLSEYIEFLTSGSRGWSQYFSDEGEYFITIKNVKNCAITLDNMQHIKAPDNAEALRTRVQEGDLLISITADLGRTGVVTKEIAEHGAYINQHLTCIRLTKEKVLPLYVAYYLESPAGKSQFAAKNQNGVKAGLNFNAINSLEIMIPPIDKQRAFISYVATVNGLALSVMNGLQKLEMLKKSLMQEYFK